MCGGRVKGGAGSSDVISTSGSVAESGERGVGPTSGSWISISELRRIIFESEGGIERVRHNVGVTVGGNAAGQAGTDKRLDEAVNSVQKAFSDQPRDSCTL